MTDPTSSETLVFTMAKTLKDTLREMQILLGKPHKKLSGAFQYYLDFFGAARGIPEEKQPSKTDKIRTIRHKNITWIDIKNPNRREISRLAEKYPFHPLHLEDCISKGQFPKLEQNSDDKYIFLLLHFPNKSSEDQRITTNQICFFLGKNYLITTHEDTNSVLSDIFNACKTSAKQKEAYMDNSAAHLLYVLIDHLTQDLAPIMQMVLKEVDEAEDIVFDDKVSGVYKIGQLRQKIISLRRMIGPLRGIIQELTDKINKFTAMDLSVYFENITHRVEKTWETLEEAKETVEVYKDADFIISTEKTNRILAVLTIVYTFGIPATVIGTFYGMNVLLPGGIEAGSWVFWGKYTTFIIIVFTSAFSAFMMAWYFKKRGWF